MSLDQILNRITDFDDQLKTSLITDTGFAAVFSAILDSIHFDGYGVVVTVSAQGSEVVRYMGSTFQPRGQGANDRREPDCKSVKCIVEAWRESGSTLSVADMDSVLPGLGRLVSQHWGERDALTLLPRRQDSGIEPRLLRWLEANVDHNRYMAVLHTDLDHFKSVNTDFGETGGDSVLKEFSSRFRARFGDIGLVMRTGGEEFSAFIFHDDSAEILVDKIRQMIPWMSVPWAAVPRSRTDSFV
jgi:diguanylate cyclase (GGDEF)-like protein